MFLRWTATSTYLPKLFSAYFCQKSLVPNLLQTVGYATHVWYQGTQHKWSERLDHNPDWVVMTKNVRKNLLGSCVGCRGAKLYYFCRDDVHTILVFNFIYSVWLKVLVRALLRWIIWREIKAFSFFKLRKTWWNIFSSFLVF